MFVVAGLACLLTILLMIAERFLCNYGSCEIEINDKKKFSVTGGQSLLDSLYENEIFIPSACGGQGTCGYCKVRILEGAGAVLPTELPYLTDDEIATSTRLACQVKVKQNMKLRIREDFLNVQQYAGTVASARMISADTREIIIRLSAPAEMEFCAGQYVQIEVPNSNERISRAYSICNPPSRKNEIELLVKKIPEGLGSTYMHDLKVGASVSLTGAYGEFQLDPEAEIICIAGGCGMAPARSIVRQIAAENPQRKCWLFYGARSENDALYYKEFCELEKQTPGLTVVYSLNDVSGNPDWQGEAGFVHLAVDKHLRPTENAQVFLCGPPLMIEATQKVLLEKQIPQSKIFYDEF